jgi:hypothetical protein
MKTYIAFCIYMVCLIPIWLIVKGSAFFFDILQWAVKNKS